MPFAQNALRKIRKRFISRSSTKKDTQQDSPSPNPSNIDVCALPDTQGLDRKDALVDNLADNLQRAVHLHKSLEVAATVLNGVDAWLPLLGASLVLAKEGIEAVQASKALKHSAHAYMSPLDMSPKPEVGSADDPDQSCLSFDKHHAAETGAN